ncbi:PH domain-containing protein [Streptomyces sp. NBC_00988]|uniref:PH domain-containing protein n=1 Tax=Streptomyces sp. NBC_00988 TaxID=2903704 RepID=UPI003866F403|nr:PH domain-containing protein [Streptomyces sp. NBC_00988]
MSGIERAYGRRRTLAIAWWQAGINVLIGVYFVLDASTNPYVSRRGAEIVILALLLGKIALVLLYRQRGRTIVGTQGISARNAVRTATRTWHDVYDIRAELNPGGRTENAQWTTYAYGNDGRRMLLPYFDDWQLPDFHAELADLRAESAQHRGMAWELRPEVEDRIRRRARHRTVSAAVCVTAVIAAAAAFVLMA